MDDELLVVRCQLGEPEAFAELVGMWHAPVWTFVRRMLDAERADDVAQEIWVVVLRRRPGSPIRAGSHLGCSPSPGGPFWTGSATSTRTTRGMARPRNRRPGDLAEEVVERTELVAALADLSILEREILVLFYRGWLDGLSYALLTEEWAAPE
ncbi:RNA polymerase sigma factor [Spirillospora sp. CA-142024]|uniref:RNA polymerase sigma factor n=1 Tax=Spirillospora sp. CA-142024 TaxID=3240036 RepID=UPI003D8E2B0B